MAELGIRHGLSPLLAATAGHPFVRWEVTDDLASTWWQVDGAAGFRRVRHTGRSSFTLLGSDDGVAALVTHLPGIAAAVEPARRGRGVFAVSVPQHLEPLLHQRFRVMGGGDWEWFHTTTAPPELPAYEQVQPLDDVGRADEVTAFLAEHPPTADTAPGQGERWFAIERADGALVAVGAWGRTRAGAPHLSSVAVAARLRGHGLGRVVVGALTRRAVLEAGVCTLGMYSDNAVGRRLYLSLGYRIGCAWASRGVTVPR